MTLNDIILCKLIIPPDAEITYESFFDNVKQAKPFPGLSLTINKPFFGCHSGGALFVFACRYNNYKYIYITEEFRKRSIFG